MTEQKRATWMPDEFVTGGESGADSIPMEVYRKFGIGLSGYMPKGYKRSDGMGAEVAALHGLKEIEEDSYSKRDRKNADISDALLGFLVDKPMTGKGTMQTVDWFTRGVYNWMSDGGKKEFRAITKPSHMPPAKIAYLLYDPSRMGENYRHSETGKPALVMWDLSKDNVDDAAALVKTFLNRYKPRSLMFSGSTAATDPDIVENGMLLIERVFE